LKYIGISEFPQKTFFWCTSENWTFASLPQPIIALKEVFVKIQTFFTGEFDNVVIFPNGNSDIVNMKEFLSQ
jgi:hypothetical protein